MTDKDIFEALGKLISDTNLFATVEVGMSDPWNPDPRITADIPPACWIVPMKWGCRKLEGDEIGQLRTRWVEFEVEVISRRGEGTSASDLAQAVQVALHGKQVLETTSVVCQEGVFQAYGGVSVHSVKTHRCRVRGFFEYLIV